MLYNTGYRYVINLAVRFETPCLEKNSVAWKLVRTLAAFEAWTSILLLSGLTDDVVAAVVDFFWLAPATSSLKSSARVCLRPLEFCFTTSDRMVGFWFTKKPLYDTKSTCLGG